MTQTNTLGGQNFGATLSGMNTMMSARQMRNFNRARSAAELSDFRVKVGAVAILGKQVLSAGWSSSKTHPRQAEFDRFRNFRKDGCVTHALHAEINCLIPLLDDADTDLNKVELYVYRIRNDQPFGLSRPCAACMAAIKQCGIKQIAYTTNDGYAVERII